MPEKYLSPGHPAVHSFKLFGIALFMVFLMIGAGVTWEYSGLFILGLIPGLLILFPIAWFFRGTSTSSVSRPLYWRVGVILLLGGVTALSGILIDPFFSEFYPQEKFKYETAVSQSPIELLNLERKKTVKKESPGSQWHVITIDTDFALVRKFDKPGGWLSNRGRPPNFAGNYWVRTDQLSISTHYARFSPWQLQVILYGGLAAFVAAFIFLALSNPEKFFRRKNLNLFLRRSGLPRKIPIKPGQPRQRKTYPRKKTVLHHPNSEEIKPFPTREDGFEDDFKEDKSRILEQHPEIKREIDDLMNLLWTATPSSLKFLLQDATVRQQKIQMEAHKVGWSIEASPEGYLIKALLLYNKGRFYSAQQRWGTATAIFQKVVELTSFNPEMQRIISNAAFDGARACFELRVPDWDQTLRFFARCQPDDLDDMKRPYFYNFLGEAYFNRGDWSKAEKCFAYHASIAKAGVEMALIQQAKCLFNLDRLNEAHIVLLDERLHKQKDMRRLQCELHYLLGDVLTAQGFIEQAEAQFSEILEIQPEFKDTNQKLQTLRNSYDLKQDATITQVKNQKIERIHCYHCGKKVSSLMTTCPFCESELDGV